MNPRRILMMAGLALAVGLAACSVTPTATVPSVLPTPQPVIPTPAQGQPQRPVAAATPAPAPSASPSPQVATASAHGLQASPTGTPTRGVATEIATSPAPTPSPTPLPTYAGAVATLSPSESGRLAADEMIQGSTLLVDSQHGRLYALVLATFDGTQRIAVFAARDGRLVATYENGGPLALDATGGRLFVDRGAAGAGCAGGRDRQNLAELRRTILW